MEERDRNLQKKKLVALRQPLLANREKIKCPICFETIPAREVVDLKNCLHGFCKYVIVFLEVKWERGEDKP